MSRTSRRDARLRLYKRGNDKCPICLAPFTKQDVEEGDAVRLEHVPAKTLGVGSVAMCLTCKSCNHGAGRAEQLAATAQQDEQKFQITIPGLVDNEGEPLAHVGYGTVHGNGMLLRMGRLRVPESEFGEALRSGQGINFKFKLPTPHYANVPWLKAAYLTVFSTLGAHGYRYAAGEALEAVRGQIMEPAKEIISKFAFGLPKGAWTEGNIMLSRDPPCWVVRMGECAVLLPRSWDTSFYERIGTLDPADVTMQGKLLQRRSAKFGETPVVFAPARTGVNFDPLKILGEDLFGAPGHVIQKNVESGKRIKATFAVADCGRWGVTALLTSVEALPDRGGTVGDELRWVRDQGPSGLRALFAKLRERIEEIDVPDFNALRDPDSPEAKFAETDNPPGGFAVWREPGGHVGFKCGQRTIRVRREDEREGLSDIEGKPALQADGSCMLEVDGHPLALWEFSRLVLEPLFLPKEKE